jgi:hypothetical protein
LFARPLALVSVLAAAGDNPIPTLNAHKRLSCNPVVSIQTLLAVRIPGVSLFSFETPVDLEYFPDGHSAKAPVPCARFGNQVPLPLPDMPRHFEW